MKGVWLALILASLFLGPGGTAQKSRCQTFDINHDKTLDVKEIQLKRDKFNKLIEKLELKKKNTTGEMVHSSTDEGAVDEEAVRLQREREEDNMDIGNTGTARPARRPPRQRGLSPVERVATVRGEGRGARKGGSVAVVFEC